MNILFITYSFPPNTLGGADLYHHNLAKQLTAKGHAVVVCTRSCADPYTIDDIEVHPLRFKDSFSKQADAVITVPSLSAGLDQSLINVTCIQHTVQQVGHPHPNAKFIYCAEWMRGMYRGKEMVYRPPMRLKEGGKRNITGPAIIGFVNNAVQKGGHYIEPMAKALPCNGFMVLAYPGSPGQFPTCDRSNVKYLEWAIDTPHYMDVYFGLIDILILPSFSEGFSTVALEALAKGVPCVARPIPGLMEPLAEAAMYAEELPEFIDAVKSVEADYSRWSALAVNRYQYLKGLNNLDELIKFILP